MEQHQSKLLGRIGRRVRRRRNQLELTFVDLAARSGLSRRFISDVEAGRANISIIKLQMLADALKMPLDGLLRPVEEGPKFALIRLLESCSDEQAARALDVIEITLGHRRPGIIALLGLRGAGKTSVGSALAKAWGLPFVELAEQIESLAGMPLGDIFTLHGEAYYRRLELRSLSELVVLGQPCVVALPGGIVGSEASRTLIAESCISIWLRAKAEDYWARVFSQGDTRPMRGRHDAMADLRALVKQRDPLYAAADLTVDTSGKALAQVVWAVQVALKNLRSSVGSAGTRTKN